MKIAVQPDLHALDRQLHARNMNKMCVCVNSAAHNNAGLQGPGNSRVLGFALLSAPRGALYASDSMAINLWHLKMCCVIG